MYQPLISAVCRRLAPFVATALLASVLAGCYGDSEFSYNSELETAATPEPEQYGDAYWAELALDYEPFVPEPGFGFAVPADEWVSKGRWGEVIDWPEIAVGAANMLDGRIVTWASEVDDFFGDDAEVTQASIFNPLTQSFEDAGYTGHNLFCAGVAMLPDGRMFLAGGGLHVSTVSVFEDNQFSEIDSMAMARWYPTSTTLPSGQVLTSLGTTASGYSELWTDGYGWQVLDNVNLQSSLNFPYYYKDWYPILNVAPDGSLFHPGPNNELFSITLDQEDAIDADGPREVGGKDRLYGTAVMYDIGKMLIAGGGQLDAKKTALTIDLNGTNPVVNNTNSMQYARAMQNSLVLPDGKVLVIGGNSVGKQFSDQGSALHPELWDPETGQWSKLAPHQKPRNYHSSALLLQDGRVIAMGGGLCGQCASNHQNGEIFEPPYLFDADGQMAVRPVINNAPETAVAGQTINLAGSDSIERFNMVRLVAMTHHHSTDLRLVPVEFNKTSAGNFQLDLHANTSVLIPGYYWIFGLDANGVPSVGHQIQIEVTEPLVETPSTTDTNVTYKYYEGAWNKLPNFNNLTPVKVGTQSDFSLNNRNKNSAYGFVFTSTITVPATGAYTFYLSSDEGSRVSINGDVVVNHDGKHKFELEKSAKKFLTKGQHSIKLEYFELNAMDGLLLSWSGPGVAKRPVTKFDLGAEVLAIDPPVVTPVGPTPPVVEPPVILPVQELVTYHYYQGNWNQLPDFAGLQPIKSGTLTNFSLAPKQQGNYYAFQFDARISVENAGAYTFYTKSDDGSKLYINNQLVVNNDGLHPAIEKNGLVTLATGEHDIRVEYFEKAGGDSLEVLWSGPGLAKQVLPQTAFVAQTTTLVTPPVTPVTPVLPPVAALPVTKMQYSVFDDVMVSVTEMANLTPVTTGLTDAFDLSVGPGSNAYGIKFVGKLLVENADTYTFTLASNDGAYLILNGNLLINNDGQHAVVTKQSSIALNQGLHDIEVHYFQLGGGSDLQLIWSRAGEPDSIIPADVLFSPLATDADVAPVVVPPTPVDPPVVVPPTTPVDPPVVVPPTPVDPPVTPPTTGLNGYTVASQWVYDIYYGTWANLPNFSTLTPDTTGLTSALDIGLPTRTNRFAMRFTGTIEVGDSGVYTFYTASDDGSKVYVDGQLVADNDGSHAPIEKQGDITLSAGTHDVVITFFQGYGGQSFSPSWAGPGFTKSLLIPGDTTVDPAVTPVVNPPTVVVPPPVVVPPVAQSLPQLQFEYFEGAWPALPDFDLLQPVRAGLINNFLLSVRGQVNQYGVQYSGQIKIDIAGTYEFYLVSNDGSRLTINDQMVINNDGRHGAIEKQGAITLQPGYHTINLDYFQNAGSEALKMYWSGPGFARQLLPDAVLYHQP